MINCKKKKKRRHNGFIPSSAVYHTGVGLYLFELHPTVQSVLHQTNRSIMWQRIQIVFCSEYKSTTG